MALQVHNLYSNHFFKISNKPVESSDVSMMGLILYQLVIIPTIDLHVFTSRVTRCWQFLKNNSTGLLKDIFLSWYFSVPSYCPYRRISSPDSPLNLCLSHVFFFWRQKPGYPKTWLQHCQSKRKSTGYSHKTKPWLLAGRKSNHKGWYKVHSLKLTRPLKTNGWKMKVRFGMASFQRLC